MSRKDNDPSSTDYDVGYGKPPVASRFKPGQSGNPRGRPRGRKSLPKELQDTLALKITVTEGGKQRRITMQEAIIRGLVNDAVRRDVKAVRLILQLLERVPSAEPGNDDLPVVSSAEDQAILADFMARQAAVSPEPEVPVASGTQTSEDTP